MSEKQVNDFVKKFVRIWMDECENRGIDYVDRPDSTTRLLARVIARTIFEPKPESD